jgi:predicted N-acyltransferase
VDADAWNALLERSRPQPTAVPAPRPTCARSHAAGCAVPATGWAPHFVTLCSARGRARRRGRALYLKTHSWGEYVFDWAWADAYKRHGLRYYPKLLAPRPSRPCRARACWRPTRPRRRAPGAAHRRNSPTTGRVCLPRTLLFPDEADGQALQRRRAG